MYSTFAIPHAKEISYPLIHTVSVSNTSLIPSVMNYKYVTYKPCVPHPYFLLPISILSMLALSFLFCTFLSEVVYFFAMHSFWVKYRFNYCLWLIPYRWGFFGFMGRWNKIRVTWFNFKKYHRCYVVKKNELRRRCFCQTLYDSYTFPSFGVSFAMSLGFFSSLKRWSSMDPLCIYVHISFRGV